MSIRQRIVAEAREWIGTRFVHQHRAKGHGVDCVGLPIGVCRNLGLVPPDMDIEPYGEVPDSVSLLQVSDQYMRRIAVSSIQPGDLIVIRRERGPEHFGIVADYPHGGLSLIHAFGTADRKGRVVEHHLDAQTLARAVVAYVLPGVDERAVL